MIPPIPVQSLSRLYPSNPYPAYTRPIPYPAYTRPILIPPIPVQSLSRLYPSNPLSRLYPSNPLSRLPNGAYPGPASLFSSRIPSLKFLVSYIPLDCKPHPASRQTYAEPSP